jgi:hypothetical protein
VLLVAPDETETEFVRTIRQPTKRLSVCRQVWLVVPDDVNATEAEFVGTHPQLEMVRPLLRFIKPGRLWGFPPAMDGVDLRHVVWGTRYPGKP